MLLRFGLVWWGFASAQERVALDRHELIFGAAAVAAIIARLPTPGRELHGCRRMTF
jgi:hypothetical protein